MTEDYQKARKLGQRECALRAKRHKCPYLPALDEKVEGLDSLERVKLGVMSIPVTKIAGTVTCQRANAFAANFMPLLDPESEFGVKWRLLCDSVSKMGVCQPIQAYEYLNRYYVVEGNKRVSVSRYLGAVFIEGEVTRIMPREGDTSPQVLLYREYLPFLRDTGINRLWFSKPGSVQKLYELLGRTPGEKWTDEERAAFLSAYTFFRRAYKAESERLDITTGDAFLMYLSVFGCEPAAEITDDVRRDRIRMLEREFRMEQEKQGVELIMEPQAEAELTTPGIFRSLLSPQKIRTAFLYSMEPEKSGWNYWHEQGRQKLEQELRGRVETTARVCTDPDGWEGEIRSLIAEGNDLIFTTSPGMLSASIRPSVEHQNVKILNCSLLASFHNVRSYYLRFYEIKFLMGMIAAASAEGDRLGYVADYPIYGVPASINAFALGARMINPRARVELRWSCLESFRPEVPFGDKPEIRVISGRDVRAPSHTEVKRGLYRLDGNTATRLASPVLEWSRIYRSMVLSLQAGRWNDDQAGTRARDYWWGLSSGALDLVIQPAVDPYAARLVRHFSNELASMSFLPFGGILRDQKGQVRCETVLSPAEILTMDWLMDNVDGTFPREDELRPASRELVRLQGIGVIQKPDTGSFSWNAETTGEEYGL